MVDLKEIIVNTTNWIDLSQYMDYLRTPCDCGIGPPGFISHGVS